MQVLKEMTKNLAYILILTVLAVSFMAPAMANAQTFTEKRVIVGFKNIQDESYIRNNGWKINHEYQNIPAVACVLPTFVIDILKKLPFIDYVEEDPVATIDASASELSASWGITQIGADHVWTATPNNVGATVKVAVIDTGINKLHEDLKNNYIGGYNFLNPTAEPIDDNGHGTHCAGIIAAEDNSIAVVGVAPKVELYALKVLNAQGSGYTADIISAIQWACNNGMDIISMSLGSTVGSTALKQACDDAYLNHDIVVVAAAGNNGQATYGSNIIYPARYANVIAVGATDNTNTRASFSCTGPELDVVAPGVNILSDYLSIYSNYDTLTMSGTSMATPHVAGVAALIHASGAANEQAWKAYGYTDGNGAWSAKDISSMITGTADDLGASGKDNYYGYGIVNAYKAALPPPAPTPDFTITANPTTVTMSALAPQTSTITVTSTNQFSSPVDLTLTAPSSWTSTANPTQVTPPSAGSATSTLTISAPSTATAGQYSITATGTSGTLTHTATVTVNLQTAPNPPQNLKTTPGNTQNTLTWSTPTSNGGSTITNYKIYRGTTPNGEASTPLATVGNVLTYTDQGLTNGKTYYYKVTAVNAIGESTTSNEASATPSAAKTMTVTIQTDRTSYSRGQRVYTTVTVKDSNTGTLLQGASVTVTIKTGTSTVWTGTGTTNSRGTVQLSYRLSSNAQTGTYQDTATVTFTGYQTGTGTTTFTVR
jgi:subtilisin